MSTPESWRFSEEQRDSVCCGELCPRCLSGKSIKQTGSVPSYLGLNAAYLCLECGEGWEGH